MSAYTTTTRTNPANKSYQHTDSSGVVEYTACEDDVDSASSSVSSSLRHKWWQGGTLFFGLQRSKAPTRRVPLHEQPLYQEQGSSSNNNDNNNTKGQPLLFHHYHHHHHDASTTTATTTYDDDKAARMAAIFLRDYEHGRAPTLPTSSSSNSMMMHAIITNQAMWVHDWRFSTPWKLVRMAAVMLWFIAAGLEGNEERWLSYACICNGLALGAFLIDMGLRHLIGLRPEPLRNAMLAFMTASSLELVYRVVVSSSRNSAPRFWITSACKPVALFYISEKARQAAVSIARIAPIVSRVLALELLLILSFATVACRLYAQYESFATLSQSWLSLFQCTCLFCMHVWTDGMLISFGME